MYRSALVDKVFAYIHKGKPHMTLTKELFHKIADPTITPDERARRRCELAKQLEMLATKMEPREAMGELWQGGATLFRLA